MGRAGDPAQVGTHLETPVAEVEVAPARGDGTEVVAGPGGKTALRTVQPPAAELHRDHHLRHRKANVGDGDPGEVQETLECSGEAHGTGPLGSVGFVTPNLGTTRAPRLVGDIAGACHPPPASAGKRVRAADPPLADGHPAPPGEIPAQTVLVTHIYAGRPRFFLNRRE